VALKTSTPPAVAALACRGCGAPLEVRAPGRSHMVACAGCGAVLDAQDPEYRVIAKYQAQLTVVPRIALGARGRLKGATWQVIGYLARSTTIEGDTYTWVEHLLYNPTGGFRWLVEYNGHWTLAKTAAGVPVAGPDKFVEYLGESYHHFQTARAEVAHVVGEFPWRVRVGETATVEDYVLPPAILSCERTHHETTWSVGEYLEGEAVWKAFGLAGAPPERLGVGAAQPSPFQPHSRTVGLLLAAFVAAAVLIQLVFAIFGQHQLVLDAAWEYQPRVAAAGSVQSVPFALTGRTSNLVIEISSTVSQSWAYFTLTLVNEDTGTSRTFGRELAYFFGRDSDGSWTEGAPWDRVWLPSVPAGRYVLLVEPESPRPVNYRIRLTRDVPRALWLWLAMGLLVVPPLVFWWRQWGFEYRRWQESDHPMSGTSQNDDDEGDDE
jgi:hypothetical protein